MAILVKSRILQVAWAVVSSCAIGVVITQSSACSDDEGDGEMVAPVQVTPAPVGEPYETLDEWNLFSSAPAQMPADRVYPYDVISPLYSDYAVKRRFFWLPEGETIGYDNDGTWEFPVGAILVKTFSYPVDARDLSLGELLLETRLLVHEPDGWDAHTYVWNEGQTEATRQVAGATIPWTWIDEHGQQRSNDYKVPNTNECQDCHGEKPALMDVMGGRTRQLDRDFDFGDGPVNQIDHFHALGLFDSAPPPASERTRLVDPFGDEDIEQRVRSYLDSNCGHCHTEGGWASESALLLSLDFTNFKTDDSANWGECKIPTSAGGATCGLTFDVVPKNPDESIMICRVASEDAEVRMPPVGSRIPHAEGIELLRQWIEGLEGNGCNDEAGQ